MIPAMPASIPSLPEVISGILAGLGLYFLGIGAIRSNLQRVPGRAFREFIGRATKTPPLAAALGFGMGMLTQTSIGVSVILAGLISRGVATIHQALPVVAWSNFGLVALIYLAPQPLHVFGLYMVGLSGLYLHFFQRGRVRGVFEPLYALGLVLLGIRLMKVNCTYFAGSHEAAWLLTTLPMSNLLALILGALARTVIQSTSAVVVLGLILHNSGIFTDDQALMVLFGTGFGTGMAAYFLTSHFKGVMRQITLFEAAINVAAGIVMVAVFYGEEFFRLPLLQHLFTKLPGGTVADYYIAYFFLVQQSLCLAFAYGTLRWMPAWLEKVSPTTREQDLSRPRYISDEAIQDFETALTLADRELAGLVQRLPDYLQTIRNDPAEPAQAEPVVLHNASLAIMGELEAFLTALSDRGSKTHSASVALLLSQRRLSLVTELDDCVWQIVQAFRGVPPTGALQSVENNIIEALDTLLRTGIDALVTGSPDDIEVLGLITASPGEVVDRLRRNYLREESQLEHNERMLILSVLSQYERIVWALQQLSRSLQANLPANALPAKA